MNTDTTGNETQLGRDEAIGAAPRLRRERVPEVLIVDDDVEFLELTEMFLVGEGFRLRKAVSASEALSETLRRRPDVIVLDLRLPGADGFATLHALRSDPSTADIPVFACSGAIEDGERVLRAGFDAHFTKPVNWPRLRELLRQLLRSRT